MQHSKLEYGTCKHFNNNIFGVDIHLQNRKGRTALYDAVKHEYIHIAKILIEYGCDTNLQDTYGNTMLHQAASNYNYEMVKYLLKKDSDPHLLNLKGETPIDLTIDDEIIRLLKDYGKTLLPGLPIEVKRFDKKSAKVFSSLFEEESYPHFESRVMLVGEQGTGKTTIARYLAGKRPSRFRIATDGIGLFNGLSYIDRQTKDWLYGKQDFSLEELAVSRSLLQEKKREKNVVSQIKTYNTKYIPDMRVDMSLSADKRKQKHQPIEPSSSDTTLEYDFDSVSSTKTFITEHVKTMSDHQLKIEPVHPGICRKDMQEINPGSERLSCRLIDDIQSSDCPSDRNEPVVHTYRTAVKEENTDSMNERESFEAQHYTVLDDTCLKTQLKGDMHIQTLTKPGVISKLKICLELPKQSKKSKSQSQKRIF
ncbi:unnamed protein product [Mytilus edulis]|uniref:Uncharacterized protein n=1 Tax=Mytilus edulis TaxID=6550 RepID=A0A8S3PNE8_MYTED|nr:unnamed protein product [Mytilus edulis]